MSRLVVGAGRYFNKLEGDVTLDIKPFEGIDVVADLEKRWPFEDDSFEYIMAYHVIEHLNDLIHFMDEAWRVLKFNGILHIETPLANGNPELEFADPTHKRCYTPWTFENYFTLNGVDNFGYTEKPWGIVDLHLETMTPYLWNRPDVIIFKGTPIK
jgi:SAM-dependent methyltransferase